MMPQTTDITADRLGRLEAMVERGFEELKALYGNMDQRLRNLENQEASCKVGLELRVTSLEAKARDNADRIKTLEDLTDRLRPWVDGMKWGLVVFGGLLIFFIWDLITGKVALMIK